MAITSGAWVSTLPPFGGPASNSTLNRSCSSRSNRATDSGVFTYSAAITSSANSQGSR